MSLHADALHPDPLAQFTRWFDDWRENQRAQPPEMMTVDAMILATTGADGLPWARTVLLKQVDARGFVFFTNRDSNKGLQLAANPQAALHFLWLPLGRQVLVQGTVEQTTAAEDDAYFASRPRESQLGAWASAQGRPLASRDHLMDRFMAFGNQYAGGDVPRPPYWGGYRLLPRRVEFWQAGAHRLHDRYAYELADGAWRIQRLNP